MHFFIRQDRETRSSISERMIARLKISKTNEEKCMQLTQRFSYVRTLISFVLRNLKILLESEFSGLRQHSAVCFDSRKPRLCGLQQLSSQIDRHADRAAELLALYESSTLPHQSVRLSAPSPPFSSQIKPKNYPPIFETRDHHFI